MKQAVFAKTRSTLIAHTLRPRRLRFYS